MLRDFLNFVSNPKERLGGGIKRKGNFVFITGMLMASYIEDYCRSVSEISGINARTVSVRNTFYGDSATVSGLLTGKDIQSMLYDKAPGKRNGTGAFHMPEYSEKPWG